MRHSIKLLASAALLAVGSSQLQAASFVYTAALSGAAEIPANASAGTGFATITIDDALSTMHIQLTFSGLSGSTSAAHIHAATAAPNSGTAGVATTTPTFAGFPLGVSAGAYDHTLDLTQTLSYNPAYLTANGGTTQAAGTALFAAMAAGKSYFNLHTTSFPGGEIRGFLNAAPVPEPAIWAMMICGFAFAGAAMRCRKPIPSFA